MYQKDRMKGWGCKTNLFRGKSIQRLRTDVVIEVKDLIVSKRKK